MPPMIQARYRGRTTFWGLSDPERQFGVEHGAGLGLHDSQFVVDGLEQILVRPARGREMQRYRVEHDPRPRQSVLLIVVVSKQLVCDNRIDHAIRGKGEDFLVGVCLDHRHAIAESPYHLFQYCLLNRILEQAKPQTVQIGQLGHGLLAHRVYLRPAIDNRLFIEVESSSSLDREGDIRHQVDAALFESVQALGPFTRYVHQVPLFPAGNVFQDADKNARGSARLAGEDLGLVLVEPDAYRAVPSAVVHLNLGTAWRDKDDWGTYEYYCDGCDHRAERESPVGNHEYLAIDRLLGNQPVAYTDPAGSTIPAVLSTVGPLSPPDGRPLGYHVGACRALIDR